MYIEPEDDQLMVLVHYEDGTDEAIKECEIWSPVENIVTLSENGTISSRQIFVIRREGVKSFKLSLIPPPFRIGAWAYHIEESNHIKLERFHLYEGNSRKAERFIYEGKLENSQLTLSFWIL